DKNIISTQIERICSIQQETRHISIDGTLYNNLGSNTVFELACVLAQLNEYLNLREKNSERYIIDKVYISVAADINFFEQIAKLRALRLLVEFLLNTYDVKSKLHIHAETSGVHISPVDVNSNLLRTSIMGSAA